MKLAITTILILPLTVTAVEPTRTIGEFLLEQQREMMAPVVEFCRAEDPTQAQRIEQAHLHFKSVVEAAVTPLNSRFVNAASRPVPVGLKLPSPGLQMLANAKQLGATTYCPQLLQMLEETSIEELQSQVERAYAQMEASARSTNSGAAQ